MDNLNIHFRCSVETVLGELEGRLLWRRFVLHYTPKQASWLNAAELEASLVSRECLGQRRVPSLVDLISLVAAWRRRAEEEIGLSSGAFVWMTRGVSFGTKDSPRAGQSTRSPEIRAIRSAALSRAPNRPGPWAWRPDRRLRNVAAARWHSS